MKTQAEPESQKPAGGTIKIVNTICQPGQRYISATEHPGSRLCQIFFIFRILDPWSPHLPTTCIRIQRYLLIEPRNRRFRSFVYRPVRQIPRSVPQGRRAISMKDTIKRKKRRYSGKKRSKRISKIMYNKR